MNHVLILYKTSCGPSFRIAFNNPGSLKFILTEWTIDRNASKDFHLRHIPRDKIRFSSHPPMI